jgi:hypothetical protein
MDLRPAWMSEIPSTARTMAAAATIRASVFILCPPRRGNEGYDRPFLLQPGEGSQRFLNEATLAVFIGIRNAWDSVTHIVVSRSD